MTKLPQLSESQIQSSFVSEVKTKYDRPSAIEEYNFRPALFYAVPNGFVGGGDNKYAGVNKLKKEGLKGGVVDLHYDQPRGGYTKFVIEFKHPDRRNEKKKHTQFINGGLSDEQIEYLKALAPYACVNVCYTVDEAMAVFDAYMELEPTGCSAEYGMIDEDEKLKGILEAYENREV